MNTERWLRAGDIFDRIFAAPRDERAGLLEQLCNDDPELKPIVASMLDAEEAPLTFEHADAAVQRERMQATTSAPPDTDGETAPLRVGPWRLVEKIGDGGMGVVWMAERADGQFEQRAALKLIKRGMDSDAVLARFLRERQILARLQHPNIAHLLDGGIAADGRPYFAMEYVDGLPLIQYCHVKHLAVAQRIELFLDMCAAVEFAHQHHVVHRDLKPSNVLVTPAGEIKLLDFGIAKVLVDSAPGDSTLTQARRERPMTPAYAAPEQFNGGMITKATDIYALGCVLYQLLTDKYAYDFRGAKRPEDMRRIIEASDPTPPSRLKLSAPPVPSRHLRGDLDTIVLAALKHDPQRRYPSVAALAEDLRNYLAGKPISARRDHLVYRGYKFLRRHRVGAFATAAVLLMAAIALSQALRERMPFGPPAPGSAVAIVDFNNLSQRSDNAWLAPALAEMLATQLAQGGRLHALPDELVRPARAGLAAPLAGGYAPKSLALLRKRLGSEYVLSGSYLVSPGAGEERLHLDLALQDARSGAALAVVTESGTLADLPELVRNAGDALRGKLGFATVSGEARNQVERAQPPNTDVARFMGQALDALHRSDPAKARDALLQVVVLAPGYAPAYELLARAWEDLGYDAKAHAAAQNALAYSDGLPPQQRLRIEREVAVQDADWDKALALDRQVLDGDPRNPESFLVMIGDLLRAGKTDAAGETLDELRKLPGVATDPRIELAAARIAGARTDPQAQLRHAERALQLAQARDEQAQVTQATYETGKAYYSLGDNVRAQSALKAALQHSQRIDNPRLEANAQVMLGLLNFRLNQPQAATDDYEAALDIYQRIGDQRGRATVYDNLMLVLWHRGDHDAAQAASRNSLEIGRATGDLERQGSALSALAYMQMDDGLSDAVLDEFREAISLLRNSGSTYQYSFALKNYSEGLAVRGELAQAREVCAQALGEAEKVSDSSIRISVGFQCASLALSAGHIDQARAGLQKVQQFAATLHDDKTLGDVEVVNAQMDMADARWAQARDRLNDAIGKFVRNDAVTAEANAQALLALCYESLHQAPERDKALARADALRSRITIALQAFDVEVATLRVRGAMANGKNAVDRLLAAASRAEKRQWIAKVLEAQLAAVQLLERNKETAAAAALRKQAQTRARALGFGWILTRLQASAAPPA
ncbi:MAG: protein kinase [Proteobacteria bacterium]|nr:protein kinase [Pseudomonadota bacterium]